MTQQDGNSEPAQRRADEFRVLYVCTGNICRSPFAEILTRDMLVARLGGRTAGAFMVSSAGVHAVVDSPMHPETRTELSPWGLHRDRSESFRARQLSSAMVKEADLVLGATPRHRSAAIEHSPAALRKAFALLEFARLATTARSEGLPEHPVARAHALVEQARLNRGMVPPAPDGDAVPDPIGKAQREHHEAAAMIAAAVESIVDLIAPPRYSASPAHEGASQAVADLGGRSSSPRGGLAR
jgi:protein-tyrosine phosphatase